MQDELFQRQWNAHHEAFTTGLKPALAHCNTAGASAQKPIGRTYDEPVVSEDPPVQIGTRLVAAGIATALLWATVIGFATTRGIPLLA